MPKLDRRWPKLLAKNINTLILGPEMDNEDLVKVIGFGRFVCGLISEVELGDFVDKEVKGDLKVLRR